MDYSLPCSSVHGIFQARVLEWAAISFSRGSSRLRDWSWVSRIVGRCLTIIQFQLLQHYWLGHRLGLPWYWMACLENEQRSFCRFWACTWVLHFGLFVDYEGYSISSKGFLPTVVDIMVIWIKFAHSSPFSSLIPKMSVLSLLFDHFQFAFIHGPNIPDSYAVLLFTASDFTSITSHIHNWALFLFWLHLFILLELFFHLSPVAYWAYTNLDMIFQYRIFLPFHTVYGFLKARILKWFAILFSSVKGWACWGMPWKNATDKFQRLAKLPGTDPLQPGPSRYRHGALGHHRPL